MDILRRRPPRLSDGRSLVDAPLGGEAPHEVIVRALMAMDNSYLAVQGPPGTGKTYTAAHVIAALAREHGWRVGVVAQSHEVVENVLRGVRRCGLAANAVGKKPGHGSRPDWTVLRPSASKLKEHPGARTFEEFHAGQRGGYVVGGTAWDFVSEARVPLAGYDLLVIDEAGQFCLANTIAVSGSTRRILLLGDPQQLPQVSQGTHPAPVYQSALGWLADGAPTLPPERGLLLNATRRLHPNLCIAISEHAYDGLLHSQDVAAQRALEGFPPPDCTRSSSSTWETRPSPRRKRRESSNWSRAWSVADGSTRTPAWTGRSSRAMRSWSPHTTPKWARSASTSTHLG